MIKVEKAEIKLTEDDLRKIYNEMKKAIEKLDGHIDDSPISNEDMSVEQYREEEYKRGKIRIENLYNGISFKILLNRCGYKKEETESSEYKLKEY